MSHRLRSKEVNQVNQDIKKSKNGKHFIDLFVFSRIYEHNFSENEIIQPDITELNRSNISLLNYSAKPVFTLLRKRKYITKMRGRKTESSKN